MTRTSFPWFRGVVGAALLLGLVLNAMNVMSGNDALVGLESLFLFTTACLLVGALILVRAGPNRIGWVLLFLGLNFALGTRWVIVAENRASVGDLDGAVLWQILSSASDAAFLLLLGLLLYWFPTGTVVSAGWRWVGWLGWLAVVFAISLLFGMEVCIAFSPETDECVAVASNPMGQAWTEEVYLPSFEASALFFLFCGATLIVRSIRARGLERLQVKWVAVAFVAMIIGFAVSTIIVPQQFTNLALGFALLPIPLAIGAAVLRYRLYDVDRIISRTVSYGLVIGLLGVIFFGLVAFLSSRVGADNQLVVAGATLAVAALFNPLRRRVQDWVDRRFNRSRYDAQRVVDTFATTLRDRVDPQGVLNGWVEVVSETMQPSSVGVWVKE